MMDMNPSSPHHGHSASPSSGPRLSSSPSKAAAAIVASHGSEPSSKLEQPPDLSPSPLKSSKSETDVVSGASRDLGGGPSPETPRLKSAVVASVAAGGSREPSVARSDVLPPAGGRDHVVSSKNEAGLLETKSPPPPLFDPVSDANASPSPPAVCCVDGSDATDKGSPSDDPGAQPLVAPPQAPVSEGSTAPPQAPVSEGSTARHEPSQETPTPLMPESRSSSSTSSTSPGSLSDSGPAVPTSWTDPLEVGGGHEEQSHIASPASALNATSPRDAGAGGASTAAPAVAGADDHHDTITALDGCVREGEPRCDDRAEELCLSERIATSASAPASSDSSFHRLSGAISLSGGMADVSEGRVSRSSVDNWSSWKSSDDDGGSFSSETTTGGVVARGSRGGVEDGTSGGGSRGPSILGREASAGHSKASGSSSALERDETRDN